MDPLYHVFEESQPLNYGVPIFREGQEHNWDKKFQVYIKRAPLTTITQSQFDYCFMKLTSHLDQFIDCTRVSSVEEVIMGTVESNSMTIDTSPSWPFTELFKTKLEALADPRVQALIDLQWANWLTQSPVAFPATLHSKDEVLPIEKIRKPRPFYSVDVVTTLNVRRLCADFNSQFSGNDESFFRAGSSQYGGQPERRFHSHNRYSYHWGADAKHYDADRKSWESLLCCKIRYYYFKKGVESGQISKESLKRVKQRLLSAYSAHDQCQILSKDGKFYDHFYQLITGFANTLEDNSMRTFFLIHLIYLLNGMEFSGYIDIMGDDFTVSTNQYISTEAIKETALFLGYTLVSPSKDEEADLYVDLFDLQFLKTLFVKHGQRIIVRYEEERLLAILYFKRSEFATMEAKVSCVLLMSYGSPLYYRLRRKLIDLCKQKVLDVKSILTHEECTKIIFGYERGEIKTSAPKNFHILTYTNNLTIKTHISTDQTTEDTITRNLQAMAESIALPTTAQDSFQQVQASETEVFTKAIPLSNDEKSGVLRKVVHPPSDEDFLGLPSGGDRSQLIMEFKQLKFPNPGLFIAGTTFVPPEANATYRDRITITMLCLNGPRVAAVQFHYDGVLGYSYQDQGTVYYNDTYNFKNWSTDVNLFRTVYKSTTVALNATAFNNVGMVAASQFNPSILFAGTVGEFLGQNRDSALKWFKDCFEKHGKLAQEDDFVDVCLCNKDVEHHTYTVHRKGGRFYDHYVKNWLSIPRSTRLDLVEALMSTKMAKKLSLNLNENGTGDVIGMAVNTLIQVLNLNNVGKDVAGVVDGVPTMSQIQQVAKSYAAEARGGLFQVQRLNTVDVAWKPASRAGGSGDSTPRLYNCYIYYTNGGTYTPLYEEQVEGASVASDVILKDALWTEDMTMGWIQFDGIVPNVSFQGTDAPVTSQYFVVKAITGVEIQPAMKGAYAQLGKKAPAIDLKMMQTLLTTQAEFKDGMPASYNSWGMLAQLAGNVISNVAPHLIKRFLAPKAAEMVTGFLKPGAMSTPKKKKAKPQKKVEIVEEVIERTTPTRARSASRRRSRSRPRQMLPPPQPQRESRPRSRIPRPIIKETVTKVKE